MTEPTLAEWLLEAIAEDEAAVGRALWSEPEPWRLGNYCERGCITIDARRVLAECQAKRHLVKLHSGNHECPSFADRCGWWVPGELIYDPTTDEDTPAPECPTLRLLAAPYSGRPGFREEWRP